MPKVEKHILSKSTFIKGHQCLKYLYLSKKRPFLRDKMTAEQRAKFKRGHAVGDLAQQLFPGGIDVSPKSPSQYQKAVEHTQTLIEQGQEVIYEATFQYDKVLVMLDILRKTPEGWVGYEVKSSKQLSDTYYTDAALQHYVITQSGLPLQQFFLTYINSDYARDADLNLFSLFKFEEVGQQVAEKKAYIATQIALEKQALTEKHSPKVEVGAHCFSPYRCDFVGFCWKKIQSKPYLPTAINLEDCAELPDTLVPLSFMLNAEAVPQCPGHKPYHHQLMAYKIGDEALQMIQGKDCDTQQAFVEQFLTRISQEQTYVVYDKSLLEAFLSDIAPVYPELSAQIAQLRTNSVGVLETLEAAKLILPQDRPKYPWTYWKLLDTNKEVALKPITSDAEALLLYRQNPNLLEDINHTDLQQFLNDKHHILELIYAQLIMR